MSSLLLYLLLVVAVGAVALAILPLRPVTRPMAALALLVALAGAATVLLWPAPVARAARGKKLIDAALPRYQFAERHQTKICATAERIAEAVKQVTPGEIGWLELLSWLRGLGSNAEARPILEIALDSNFIPVADTPAELVLGTGGEFWRYRSSDANLRKSLEPGAHSPAAFASLDLSGRPKAVLNFAIDPAAFGCKTVTTETRIHAADPGMQKQFAAYWRVIQPGSALLRRTWLDAIRRRAEAK